jgi:hypothetical protein
MNVTSWWKTLRDGAGRRRRDTCLRPVFRPLLEMLEVRRLPSVQAVSLAMPPSASATPDGASSQPAVSADGRFVAFVSNGQNLTTLQPALT